jgi:hypothetical protein
MTSTLAESGQEVSGRQTVLQRQAAAPISYQRAANFQSEYPNLDTEGCSLTGIIIFCQ